jgi:hypothetical protein
LLFYDIPPKQKLLTRRSVLIGVIVGPAIIGRAKAQALRLDSGAAGPTLQQIDGGPTFYADHGFTYAVNAGRDDPSFFPVGLWLPPMHSRADAIRWLDLGINTAFCITSNSTLALLRANRLWLVKQTSEVVRDFGSETVGLMTNDEQNFAKGVSDPLGSTPNAIQDGRFWYVNNTWNFIAYGPPGDTPAPVTQQHYLSYLVNTPNGSTRHIDIQSVDMYWVAGSPAGANPLYWGRVLYNLGRNMTPDEMRRCSHYGDMVDRIRGFQGAYPAPIFNFVENGGPFSEDTTAASYITPSELNWAVWSNIIHGARGIIYSITASPGRPYHTIILHTPTTEGSSRGKISQFIIKQRRRTR